MSQPIRLGISTCPNDTFAFAALLEHRVDWRGLDFQVELLDIQQLNERLFAGDFDVAKTSFHAALHLAEETVVLPSGSALGFGVGPLLLAAQPDDAPRARSQLALCPGRHTTAMMLFQMFYRDTVRVEQAVFSDIMLRLRAGTADFGVCIHEGRFTWQAEGLSLVEDLGTRWEAETNMPLPLGGLVARRSLLTSQLATIQAVIHDSLQTARAAPATALPTMRRYAQAFEDAVLMQHVDLYVNDWTVDLGEVGREALGMLSRQAKRSGLIEVQAAELQVWQTPDPEPPEHL